MLPVSIAKDMQRVSQLWTGEIARAERTENMKRMSVALDVSKLSGWLNADAFCRVGRRIEIDGYVVKDPAPRSRAACQSCSL